MSDLKNKETFSKNLKRYMELSGKERGEIANELNISYSTFTDWINGNAFPRIDKIELLANYFEINKSDLIEEKGLTNNKNLVPILGTIAAGTPILAEQNIGDYFNIDSKIKADFALLVKGDSMINAHIHDGDIAFIKQQCELENGEIGAVLIDNEATLKKFYKTDNTIILQADNNAYKPIILTNGNVKILGKLVAVLNIRN